MKTINVTFTDKEFQRINKIKRESPHKNWHKFIINTCKGVFDGKNNSNKD